MVDDGWGLVETEESFFVGEGALGVGVEGMGELEADLGGVGLGVDDEVVLEVWALEVKGEVNAGVDVGGGEAGEMADVLDLLSLLLIVREAGLGFAGAPRKGRGAGEAEGDVVARGYEAEALGGDEDVRGGARDEVVDVGGGLAFVFLKG